MNITWFQLHGFLIGALPVTLWAVPLAIILALGSVGLWWSRQRRETTGSSVFEITGFVQDCAGIYLKSQYKLVAKVMVAFAAMIFLGSFLGHFSHFFGIVIFFGGLWSAVVGYLSLRLGLSIAAKSAEEMQTSPVASTRRLCLSGGMLVTLCGGVVLADMFLWFSVLNWIFDHNLWQLSMPIVHKMGMAQTWRPEIVGHPDFIRFKFDEIALILLSYAIGASVYALLGRIGGGILRQSTHAAIANAFATSHLTLPEDDIRHPGIMAAWIGRHAGGVTGTLAGLYQLMAICLAMAIYLGAFLLESMPIHEGIHAVVFPFLVLGIGLLSALAGFGWLAAVRMKHPDMLPDILSRGQWIVAGMGMAACLGLWLTHAFFEGFVWAAMMGIVVSTAVGLGMRRFGHRKGARIASLLDAAPSGFGALLLRGVELGFRGAGIPILGILVAFGTAYVAGNGLQELATGMYAVILCAVAALGNGLYLYGAALSEPLAATGLGLSRMLQHEPSTAHLRTVEADLGNARVATDMGYALVLALLVMTTMTALLVSLKHWIHKLAGTEGIQMGHTYFVNHPIATQPQAVVVSDLHVLELAERLGMGLLNPQFAMGLLVGLMTVIGLSGWCIRKANACAEHLAMLNRREFIENPDIVTGAVLPNYGSSISFSTLFSQKCILTPFLFACVSTVGVSFLWGIAGTIGHLLGTLMAVLIITLSAGALDAFWHHTALTVDMEGGRFESPTATRVALNTLGKAGAIVPGCVGPILNTVMILMLSLAMLLGLLSLKYGHVLVH